MIFDLRDCTGGYPEMVRSMASWLFDHPVAWYNPRANSSAESVTDSPVPGSTLADKPVFILTSSRTFSGAEHFTYDLKLLKRATIVGETTSGASHAGPITPSSQIADTETKPVWEGAGVQPDRTGQSGRRPRDRREARARRHSQRLERVAIAAPECGGTD